MTIGTAGARVTFNCDGVSKVFPVAIQGYLAVDFNVILTSPTGVQTSLVLNSDYSLAASGSLQPTAWTLTTLPVAAYPGGYTLQVFINPQQVQQTQYVQGQAFPSLAIQTNLDRLTQMVQRLQDELNRAVRAPDGDVSPSMLLPAAQVRSLTYCAFDVNGNAICVAALPGSNVTAAGIGAVLYPIQAIETAVGVVPANIQYPPLDPRRYGSTANWSAVYGAASSPSDTDWPFYRGDHAQHPSQTNAIAGYKSFDDSKQAGTVGWHCTAFGSQALQLNGNSVSAGGTNTAFGWAALQNNVEGSGNTAVGPLALNSLTGINSSHNNAFGYRSLTLLVNGTQNEVFGFQGANSLTTGSNNHAFGENVLQALTLGSGNHHFGYQAGFNKVVGDFSHAFGYQALTQENQGTITAISQAASAVVSVNTVSVANPFSAGSPVSFEGVGGMTQINGVFGQVIATGGVSGAWTATVNINSSGFGAFTASGAMFPLGNTAVGYQAGVALNCAGANTLIGWQAAGINPVDVGNTCLGYQAGLRLSTGGVFNVALGYQALVNCLGGADNVAIGFSAGTGITTGTENVAIGDNAGQAITTESSCVFVGGISGTNLKGSSNTGVGYAAGTQGSPTTLTDTQSFGTNATPTASHQVTLGSATITTLRCQVTTITALSDVRFKKHVETLDLPDAFLDEVRMVAFEWIGEGMAHHGRQMGVIAQELDALQEKYGLQWLGLVDKSNPDQWEATPGKLLFPLIQRVQKQNRRLQLIEDRLAKLEDAV